MTSNWVLSSFNLVNKFVSKHSWFNFTATWLNPNTRKHLYRDLKFKFDVHLCVVCIELIGNVMSSAYFTYMHCVQYKQNRIKHRALRHPIFQQHVLWYRSVNWFHLIARIWYKPAWIAISASLSSKSLWSMVSNAADRSKSTSLLVFFWSSATRRFLWPEYYTTLCNAIPLRMFTKFILYLQKGGQQIYLFIRSFIYSYIHSFIYLFIHSFIHSFIYSFIHSFIYSFIYSSWPPVHKSRCASASFYIIVISSSLEWIWNTIQYQIFSTLLYSRVSRVLCLVVLAQNVPHILKKPLLCNFHLVLWWAWSLWKGTWLVYPLFWLAGISGTIPDNSPMLSVWDNLTI